jgi:hypothetical protein
MGPISRNANLRREHTSLLCEIGVALGIVKVIHSSAEIVPHKGVPMDNFRSKARRVLGRLGQYTARSV